jgi:hypothetical protein
MNSPLPESEGVGLCFSCRHMRPVRTDRGSVFYLCERAATDPQFPKYPCLPVLECRGYEKKDEPPNSLG